MTGVHWVRAIFRVLLAAAVPLGGSAAAGDEFDRVNALRAQAGLPTLAVNEALAAAAARHARYLDRHREPGAAAQGLSAHAERPGVAEFSGETPAARAIAAGYPHREVLENVSMGYADAASAIDGLMGAIYHRLTFLDLEMNEMGVAVGERSRVFMLGRTDLGTLCEAPPPAALSRAPLDCLGQPITRAHYEALCAGLPDEALFRGSHPIGCPNGARLDAAFMQSVCAAPPPEAAYDGRGRYYEPCENGTRIAARWFDAACEGRPPEALYAASGHYYEICEGPRKVQAEWFEAWCASVPEAGRYRDSGRYRRPCAADTHIRAEYLDELDAQVRAGLPEVVLWPPDGATDVPPAFFIEEPDPLPDLDLSGFPVSIQFNPAAAGEVEIRAFRLQRIGPDGAPAGDAAAGFRLLDQGSDPNGLLSSHEFALFPLERLAWGSRYRASVDARVDGVPRAFAWSFETQGADTPLLTAPGARQRFVVQSGVDYLLYLPPDADHSFTVLSTRTRHQRGNRVTLELVDPNTLKVRVDARICDRIRMRFDSERTVELVPAGCAG